VRVAIATDSPASTPGFDMFEELRAAVAGARAREQDAGALTAADALELATLAGARALGLASEIGSLTPGKQADVAVLSLEGSPFEPVEDPAAAAVLGGSPERVLATLVGGEDRYRRGTTAWRDLTRAARRARSRMLT
jgi:5-methylthioadenosine/S-adenosylhomocysteine deaminase